MNARSGMVEKAGGASLRQSALLAALPVGIFADLLVRSPGRPGIGMALWALIGAGTLGLLARLRSREASRESRLLIVAALGFAWLIPLRDAHSLAALCVLSGLILVGFAAGRGALAWARDASIFGVAAGAIRTGVFLVLGPLGWSIGTRRAGEVPATPSGGSRSLAGILLRGVIMGLPPLLILTLILMSADPVFDGMVRAVFAGRFEPTLDHLLFTGLIAWIGSGYFRAFLHPDEGAMERIGLPRPALAPAEIAIALSLLALLFFTFLAVQVRYLFGGSDLVEVTPGLTYAEYTRRGFFEMAVATLLVVPLLLVADWAASEEDRKGRRLMRMVALLLVALLAGVLASAAYRMALYQAAYGLTEDRLFGSVFLLWLTGVLAWLAATVLRERRDGFLFGAAMGGVACIALLHLINPHAVIARVNLDRAAAGVEYDANYTKVLSADAVPTLIERLPSLPEADRCAIHAIFDERWRGSREGGWRNWNVADARARRLVAGIETPAGCAALAEGAGLAG